MEMSQKWKVDLCWLCGSASSLADCGESTLTCIPTTSAFLIIHVHVVWPMLFWHVAEVEKSDIPSRNMFELMFPRLCVLG